MLGDKTKEFLQGIFFRIIDSSERDASLADLEALQQLAELGPEIFAFFNEYFIPKDCDCKKCRGARSLLDRLRALGIGEEK